MMRSNAHLELGEFLKARRAELSPRTVGLPETGSPRRVRGLRREEVAQLAAISTDYYTRLEQGRMPASQGVLDTLARALHLDDDQRAYLYELAGKGVARPRRAAPQKVRPQMQRLLDQLTESPAIIQGRRFDILAWNPMAAALMLDFSTIPEQQRNYARLLFTHSVMRQLYDDWESVARKCVALLRMEAAQYPDDPRLSALVGELSVQNRHFRALWAEHHVASKGGGTRIFHHPVVGVLALDWDTVVSLSAPHQELVVWTAAPGTPAHDGLRRLKELSTSPK
jgi:transcriptional regulator with XRE-family HTH domain